MRNALLAVAVLGVLGMAAAGCTSSAGDPTASRTSPVQDSSTSGASTSGPSTSASSTPLPSRSSTPSSSSSPPASVSAAQRVLARMNLRERVGQLLMVDCPSTGVSDATVTAIRDDHVGSVILDGTTQQGMAATRNVTANLRQLAPSRIGLFISTDQEGGMVQRLEGTGFSSIPSAVEQGAMSPDALRRAAQGWGDQLRRAGVNLNLAPVLDTVPSGGGPNPPIGDLEREYGHAPQTVQVHGLAYARGMLAADVDSTVKHFPGLGRVSGNTDTTAGVTDTTTTGDDAYLGPFRAAVSAKVPFVMMSTAIYSRIDVGTPAAFSRPIVTGLLRHKLGFGGVVISDDLGVAKQVAQYSVGQRAVKFVRAGGDMVLTVDAGQAGEMTGALAARAQADASFRAEVDAAALRVLQAKQARGLLH